MPIRNFINADTVDGFHASQIPSPDTIPVAGQDGKLDSNWISTVGLNADTVDGFHASQIPSPDTIPVADASGKLASGWLPPLGFQNKVSFTSSGTWIVPNGVSRIFVIGWAGGGGGGGGNVGIGGGGGAGGCIVRMFNVVPGEALTITIGAGGAGGGWGSNGGNGGNTVMVGSVSGILFVVYGGLGGQRGSYTPSDTGYQPVSGSGGLSNGGYTSISGLTGGRGCCNLINHNLLGGASGNPGQPAPPNSGAGGGGGASTGGAGGSGYVEIWY